MVTIRTVGHGTLDADSFASLVLDGGCQAVVDVRRYPGSRRHPHFAGDEMSAWLPAHGVAYRWLPSLGGRRKPTPHSANVGLRNPQFRAYGDHMASEQFAAGIRELLTTSAERRVGVMCSEALWWRCHRRLVADHLVLVEGQVVEHLLHDGRLVVHSVTPGARRSGRHVVYDLASEA